MTNPTFMNGRLVEVLNGQQLFCQLSRLVHIKVSFGEPLVPMKANI